MVGRDSSARSLPDGRARRHNRQMELGDRGHRTVVGPGAGLSRRDGRSSAVHRWRPAAWVVFLALAVVAGALPSFSLRSGLLVAVAGGGLFGYGLLQGRRAELAGRLIPAQRRPHAAPPTPGAFPAGARWWLWPVGSLVIVEAASFLLGSTFDHPTLSQLADPWLESYPVRAGAFLGWVSAFWALARR